MARCLFRRGIEMRLAILFVETDTSGRRDEQLPSPSLLCPSAAMGVICHQLHCLFCINHALHLLAAVQCAR